MANMTFEEQAWPDYLYWQGQDKKTLKRINTLLKDINRSAFDGIGKPEPLKDNLSGYWSRRIDEANRIVYKEQDGVIIIAMISSRIDGTGRESISQLNFVRNLKRYLACMVSSIYDAYPL